MQTKKIAVIALLFALAFAAAASFANAQVVAQSASVWTTDSAGTAMNQFSPGQQIDIYWNTAPVNAPVIITLFNSQMQVVNQWNNQVQSSDSPIVLANGLQSGYYYITVNTGAGASAPLPIAVATLFVLPESIFGTISAIGAGFAAFGLVGFVKMRKHKKD